MKSIYLSLSFVQIQLFIFFKLSKFYLLILHDEQKKGVLIKSRAK